MHSFYKLLPFYKNQMLKTMQKHTHALLFFIWGLFLMLVWPSLIPFSSAATVIDAFTVGNTTYLYLPSPSTSTYTYTLTVDGGNAIRADVSAITTRGNKIGGQLSQYKWWNTVKIGIGRQWRNVYDPIGWSTYYINLTDNANTIVWTYTLKVFGWTAGETAYKNSTIAVWRVSWIGMNCTSDEQCWMWQVCSAWYCTVWSAAGNTTQPILGGLGDNCDSIHLCPAWASCINGYCLLNNAAGSNTATSIAVCNPACVEWESCVGFVCQIAWFVSTDQTMAFVPFTDAAKIPSVSSFKVNVNGTNEYFIGISNKISVFKYYPIYPDDADTMNIMDNAGNVTDTLKIERDVNNRAYLMIDNRYGQFTNGFLKVEFVGADVKAKVTSELIFLPLATYKTRTTTDPTKITANTLTTLKNQLTRITGNNHAAARFASCNSDADCVDGRCNADQICIPGLPPAGNTQATSMGGLGAGTWCCDPVCSSNQYCNSQCECQRQPEPIVAGFVSLDTALKVAGLTNAPDSKVLSDVVGYFTKVFNLSFKVIQQNLYNLFYNVQYTQEYLKYTNERINNTNKYLQLTSQQKIIFNNTENRITSDFNNKTKVINDNYTLINQE